MEGNREREGGRKEGGREERRMEGANNNNCLKVRVVHITHSDLELLFPIFLCQSAHSQQLLKLSHDLDVHWSSDVLEAVVCVSETFPWSC